MKEEDPHCIHSKRTHWLWTATNQEAGTTPVAGEAHPVSFFDIRWVFDSEQAAADNFERELEVSKGRGWVIIYSIASSRKFACPALPFPALPQHPQSRSERSGGGLMTLTQVYPFDEDASMHYTCAMPLGFDSHSFIGHFDMNKVLRAGGAQGVSGQRIHGVFNHVFRIGRVVIKVFLSVEQGEGA